jgi:hypothetical protein
MSVTPLKLANVHEDEVRKSAPRKDPTLKIRDPLASKP